MILNYTYRIYPDAATQQLMQSWLETCRFAYNRALRELKDWLASRKSSIDRCSIKREYVIGASVPFPGYQKQQNDLPKLKQEFPLLGDVYSQVLQTTIRRLHDTWDAFQKRGFGFPRFKKFGQFKSFVFPQFKDNPLTGSGVAYGGASPEGGFPSVGNWRWRPSFSTPLTVTGYHIKLPKIGLVPINVHRPIPDGFVVKQARVLSKCRNTQWYVVLTLQAEVSIPDVPVHGRAIGIDLGLERFLTASDGSSVKRPKFLKGLQSELKSLQRRVSRTQKRSKNWEKAQVKVARLHHKIANTRKDYHFKTAHSLCNQAQTIFAEDLNTVGLNRGMLRSECIDASFGQFLSLLSWVCFKRGAFFKEVNPRGTSQTCPECQATVTKPLSEREHICPECGYRTHRDHAAAEMVLLRGLELVSTPGFGGTETAYAVDLPGAGVTPSRQEAKSRRGKTRKAKS